MMKDQYKGYRIWAILQTNGKYRACFFKSPIAINAKVDITPVIEGDSQNDAIGKARDFLDRMPELHNSSTLAAGGDRWAV
jgi:hypothetical protein